MSGKQGRSGRKPEKRATAPAGRPECPDWLNDTGKRYWHRTVEHLEQMPGILSTVDEHALSAYAHAWQEFHDAELVLYVDGATVRNEKQGSMHAHPDLTRRDRALERIKYYLAKFGFTPEARARLKIATEATETDPFAEFLARRNETMGNQQ